MPEESYIIAVLGFWGLLIIAFAVSKKSWTHLIWFALATFVLGALGSLINPVIGFIVVVIIEAAFLLFCGYLLFTSRGKTRN